MALVEYLGLVATAAQQVAEHAPELSASTMSIDLLAELIANAVVLLAEEMATLRDGGSKAV